MRRSLVLVSALLLAGCDPFVVQVDDSRICTAVAAQSFAAGSGGLKALVPLGVSLDEIPVAKDASGSAELLSVTVVAADGSDLGYVTGARVRVVPAPQLGSTIGDIVAGTNAAPQLSDGTLTISGTDADIFPQIASGPAQLSVELDAPAGHALTANIGICVQVSASAPYLN